MIVLHCGKPKFINLPVSTPIYRSKSTKVHLCTTTRSKIIFMRTTLPYFCFLFVCLFVFLNFETEIMLNMLFNTLLTIAPHNRKKKKKK